jgi:thioredoxin-dependent peroxiredoxin
MPLFKLAALRSCLHLMLLLLGLAIGAAAHGAATPTVGSAAPAFSLTDQSGQPHRLADYQGKWVVLYFYPKDGTPGCTTEACEFRDNIFAFRDLGVVVLGVSLDDVGTHAKFAAEQHLPFPLLADADKKVSEAYGVLARLAGLVSYSKRETFVIDPKGRVAKHYSDVDPKTHSKSLLADLRSLQASR